MGEGYDAATSEVGCPWDIASRAHILLRSSELGLCGFIRRWLTGYAICYNHRHRRWGHLFQNRYKSIVCDEREKVSIEELTSGSRRKEVSAIRGRIAIGFRKIWDRIS